MAWDEVLCPMPLQNAHTSWIVCAAELEEHKEAKARREGSPWADCQDAHADYTAAFPSSAYHKNDADADVDMEQDTSPAEGETGYFETAQDSAFQFEPPRAPAHYGASRNSPSDDPSRAGSYNPWVASAGYPLMPQRHTAVCCMLSFLPLSYLSTTQPYCVFLLGQYSHSESIPSQHAAVSSAPEDSNNR